MEGALVFATSAGLGYMLLRDQYQNMLDKGPSLVGVNEIVRAQVPNQPVYVRGNSKQNFTDPADYTPEWRQRHQDSIDRAHLEYPHPVLNPYKFSSRQSIGPQQDTDITTLQNWVN